MKRNTRSVIKLWALVGAIIVCIGTLQCSALANTLGVPDAEYNALVALYNSTNGDGWANHENWLTENTNWYGVFIEDGHVTGIYLGYNQLTGTIPPELGNLAYLLMLSLWGNQLTGAIPPELGDLTNLSSLYLGNNQLIGSIPAELGDLTNLQLLYLDYNQLTGPIPPELDNLTNLQWLNLSYNQLTATIPPELGNLTSLQGLYLCNNRLIGPIPPQMGNLTNLSGLDISSNRFIEEVPSWITDLTALSYLDIGYNGFSCSDPAVLAFLASKNPDWQSSQTVPPTNIFATILTSGSASVSWTPVAFNWYDGHYEIGYSSTPGGPYTFDPANVTYDKWTTSITITGLDLSHSMYFVVRTVSLSGWWNQSTLTSLLSSEFMMLPPVTDKQGSDGAIIDLSDMVVTAILPDCFYVEKLNRAWGIRVDLHDYNLERGQRVNIVGTLSTNEDGERCIEGATYGGGGPIDPPPPPPFGADSELLTGVMPMYMSNRTLGGSNWRYDTATGAGQCGVDGGSGLNNVGLLVKTTGKVIFAGREWLYIDDGSGLDDGSGIKGLYVEAKGYPSIPNGAVIWVTGISSIDRYNGRIVNTLLAIDGGIISSPSPMSTKVASVSEADPVNPRKH